MAEAIDTALTLGWALAAWIAVLAAVVTVVLLAGCAAVGWAVRGACVAVGAAVAAVHASRAIQTRPNPARPGYSRARMNDPRRKT